MVSVLAEGRGMCFNFGMDDLELRARRLPLLRSLNSASRAGECRFIGIFALAVPPQVLPWERNDDGQQVVMLKEL